MFELFRVLDGYDNGLKDVDQDEMWEEWFCDCAIDEIAEYHKLHPDEGVFVYKNGEIPKVGHETGGNIVNDNDAVGMMC